MLINTLIPQNLEVGNALLYGLKVFIFHSQTSDFFDMKTERFEAQNWNS